jgi:hypothetical protein
MLSTTEEERAPEANRPLFGRFADLLAAESATQGLGDVTTSPWLGDARIGVTSHLEMFRNGGSFLVPDSASQRFIQGAASIGRQDGLFVTTSGVMDNMLAETAGDLSAINQKLETTWNEPLWGSIFKSPFSIMLGSQAVLKQVLIRSSAGADIQAGACPKLP